MSIKEITTWNRTNVENMVDKLKDLESKTDEYVWIRILLSEVLKTGVLMITEKKGE